MLRPSRTSESFSGARWALKKHADWRREFALNGNVDLDGEATYTDQDGDEWGVTSSGNPTTFEIQSGGLVLSASNNDTISIVINPKTLIPGLRPTDPLWAIFRISTPISLFDGSLATFGFRRNISAGNEQNGLWKYVRTGGLPYLNPHVTGENSATQHVNQETPADVYLSINVSGLLYEYRKQALSVDFPATPEPDDIPLFSDGSFNGRFSSTLAAAPVAADIDLADELLSVELTPGGGATFACTLTDIWLYRYE